MTTHRAPIILRKRPLVVLSLHFGAALQAVVDSAREWEWDVLDLRLTRGSLPDDPPPSGALINTLPTDADAKRLRAIGCPTVRLGRLPHPQDELLPCVLPDQAAAGRLAVDHFVERGFRHLANIGSRPWSMARPMHEAFAARARELGLTPTLLRLGGGGGPMADTPAKFESRARTIGNWLSGLPKPVAVLAYDDWLAAKLCVICKRVGLSVPEDVAVLGVGNHALRCEMSPVLLSSVDPNQVELGRQAALLLRGLMNGDPAPPGPVMVPPRGIVARRSTEVLAVGNPVVARAMRFMWDHLDQQLSVDTVAAEVGLPRRSLERAFRDHLGRGVNTELRRRRLERCCELLRTTELPIVDLAPQLGFRSADYLHTAFRKAFGTTPRKYRMRRTAG